MRWAKILLVLAVVLLIAPSIALAAPFSVSQGAGKAWNFLTEQHEIGGSLGKALAAIGSNPIGNLALGFFGINVEGGKVTTSVGEMLLNLTMVTGVGVAAKVLMGARVAVKGARMANMAIKFTNTASKARKLSSFSKLGKFKALKGYARNLGRNFGFKPKASRFHITTKWWKPPAITYRTKGGGLDMTLNRAFWEGSRRPFQVVQHEVHEAAMRWTNKWFPRYYKGIRHTTKKFIRDPFRTWKGERVVDFTRSVFSKKYSQFMIRSKKYGKPGTLVSQVKKMAKSLKDPKFTHHVNRYIKKAKHALPSVSIGFFKPKKTYSKKYSPKKRYYKKVSFKKRYVKKKYVKKRSSPKKRYRSKGRARR